MLPTISKENYHLYLFVLLWLVVFERAKKKNLI